MDEELKLSVAKVENQEGPEISPEQAVESPEDFREQILQESQGEVATFTQEGEAQIAQVEARAETAGLTIDEEDKEALQVLATEAAGAQAQLITEITPADEEKYQQFASREKVRWAEQGMNPLLVAEDARRSVEMMLKQEEGSLENYKGRVEALRSDIDAKKSSIISHILNFREIQSLKRQLGTVEHIRDSAEKFTEDRKELLVAYDRLVSEQKELGALMEDAYKENAEWDEGKRQEFLREEEGRSVSNLTAKHGVFFVHDIVVADWKPSENNRAIDTQKLGLLDQLDIVQGLGPTISVSTLEKDTKQKTFGEGAWGVFLSGGRVLGGEPTDAGTIAHGLRDRRLTGGESNKTVEGIERAIHGDEWHDRKSGYNELVVENPEVAGVYVKWDGDRPPLIEGEDIVLSKKDKYDRNDRYAAWWETISSVVDRGLPLFVINRADNSARMIYDINISQKSFKVTPEYNPQDMVDIPGIYKQHLGEEERRKAAMRVFDKAVGLIPEEERAQYVPDGTEKDGKGLYNIH